MATEGRYHLGLIASLAEKKYEEGRAALERERERESGGFQGGEGEG